MQCNAPSHNITRSFTARCIKFVTLTSTESSSECTTLEYEFVINAAQPSCLFALHFSSWCLHMFFLGKCFELSNTWRGRNGAWSWRIYLSKRSSRRAKASRICRRALCFQVFGAYAKTNPRVKRKFRKKQKTHSWGVPHHTDEKCGSRISRLANVRQVVIHFRYLAPSTVIIRYAITLSLAKTNVDPRLLLRRPGGRDIFDFRLRTGRTLLDECTNKNSEIF